MLEHAVFADLWPDKGSRVFKGRSIRGKLQAVILMTTGAALALTCATFIAYELLTYHRTESERLITIGHIIAESTGSSLAFSDTTEAYRCLSAVHGEPEISVAALYTLEGRLFAEYRRPGAGALTPPSPLPGGIYRRPGQMELFTDVYERAERYGMLYLRSELEPVYLRMGRYALISLVVFLGAMLAAYFIGRLLQEGVSRPIMSLTNTARAVAERHDYSVRAERLSHDELGVLTDALNQMLAVIHQNQERLTAAQEELENANRRLEATVAERTAALREMVAQLETFSYSVTHDMRGPLRAMTSFAQLLKSEYAAALDENAQDYLRRITDSAKRLDSLIQDVLQYSRLGREQLILEPVDLGRLTEDIVEQYPDIAGKKQHISIDESCRGCMLRASAAALTQVISNLINNALKFVPPGRPPNVRIGCETIGNVGRVTVQDNGVGIPSNQIHKIFGVFVRLHGADYPGTGIGLSIVKKAIERMGGSVGVESEPGIGSKFWFELPKAVCDSEQQSSASSSMLSGRQ